MLTNPRWWPCLGLGLVFQLLGCSQPSAFQCGERICPVSTVCIESLGLCVTAEQRDACDGSESGECQVGDRAGFCRSSVCVVAGCGNGFLEGLETCDDGNVDGGDGCSGTCDSEEICGNGIVDVLDVTVAEGCDDGNVEGGDGCSASCVVETCGDGVVDVGEVCDDGNGDFGDGCAPSCISDESCGNGVLDAAAATPESCDDANQSDNDGCGSSCEVELLWWMRRSVQNGMTSMGISYDRPMTFDSVNTRVLMFDSSRLRELNDQGGFIDVSGAVPFDGGGSTRLSGGRLAYDSSRAVTVLFGGITLSGNTGPWNDTFEISNGTVQSVVTTNRPSPRQRQGMVYDNERGNIVMFGGDSGTNTLVYGTANSETWTYDGEWMMQSPAVTPPARSGQAMVYDSRRNVVVMFGGWSESGFALPDTWEWDGTSWAQVFPAQSPPARHSAAVAFDSLRNVMVVRGGLVTESETSGLGDSWEFNGTTWRQRDLFTGPPTGRFRTAVYDEGQRRLTYFTIVETSPGLGASEVWQLTSSVSPPK